MTDLISLHYNNTDCLGTPTAITVMKTVCNESQLPFVKTFCGNFENAQEVFHKLHPRKPLFESVFYQDKECKNEIYSAISLADKNCHFFRSVHPNPKDKGDYIFDSDTESVKKTMAYKGGKKGLKIYLDQKECKKSPDFKMKVSQKCQKLSHHSMFGTLSYVEVETPVVDYAFWGMIALIFAGVGVLIAYMSRKKGRVNYQPVMI